MTGYWHLGKFYQDDYDDEFIGVFTSFKDEELHMVPEADRISELYNIYTDYNLKLTHATSSEGAGTSDIVVHHGNCYKIINKLDYSEYGYYRYVITRIGAENNA